MKRKIVFKTWQDFFDWVYPEGATENRLHDKEHEIHIEEEPETYFSSVIEALRAVCEG